MKLIIGLGNPDAQYQSTRHNVGFHMLDTWTHQQGGEWREKAKFRAYISELVVDGEKIICAKPTTYYNLSGESYRMIADFYQIESVDTLIIHDDMDLPLGTLRTRGGGSGGGNNGIKSINAHGGAETLRLRIGVAGEHREQSEASEYVLGRFSADEMATMSKLEPRVCELIDDFVSGSLDTTTHRHES